MNKLEMTQILTEARLLYGHRELTKEEVSAWFNFFGAGDALSFKKAVEIACKSNKFFPTPGEVQSKLDSESLPRSLTMTSSQALIEKDGKLILVVEAKEYANKSVVFANDQYSNPEELALALRIHKARWDREFKERFEYLQNAAKAKVHLGIPPKEAILGLKRSEIEPSKTEAKKLLEGFKGIEA